MKISPMEAWIKDKIAGVSIKDWQLNQLNQTLELAQNSPFYRETLPVKELASLDDIQALPFLTCDDLVKQEKRLLCVNQKEIDRIVTLDTSGSTGAPKRVYFTKEDQELTMDFFDRGMLTLVNPQETMAVLLPCLREGGVGDLICRAIRRIPVEPVAHGMIKSLEETLQMFIETGAQTLVGIPIEVLTLARYSALRGKKTNLRSVLLSTDYVPQVLIRELNRLCGWEVYGHYGMTEMGLGSAIDCDAHLGYHMREADLYFEIIDPVSGKNLPDGQYGEVVFTTLTRKGMPLIRYRTGDISRLLPGKCPCGADLRRLETIKGRFEDLVCLYEGAYISMPELSEVILALPQVMDFVADIDNMNYMNNIGKKILLSLEVATFVQMPKLQEKEVIAALQAIPALNNEDKLKIEVHINQYEDFTPLYRSKRLIKRSI